MADLICAKGDRPTLDLYFGVNIQRLSAAAAAGALTIVAYDTTGWQAGDVLLIAPQRADIAHDKMERRTIATDGVAAATGVVTLTAALRFAHLADAEVWEAKAPSAVTIIITDPDGTAETKTLADLSLVAVGHYTLAYTFSVEGTYVISVVTTGDVVAATTDLRVVVAQTQR